MARQLVWSLRARQNLRDVLGFITQRSPSNAAPVAKRFFARVASVANQPGQGRRVPEHEGDDELREVFVHSWRIIYRVTAEEVTVVAIVHGARLLKNVPPL